MMDRRESGFGSKLGFHEILGGNTKMSNIAIVDLTDDAPSTNESASSVVRTRQLPHTITGNTIGHQPQPALNIGRQLPNSIIGNIHQPTLSIPTGVSALQYANFLQQQRNQTQPQTQQQLMQLQHSQFQQYQVQGQSSARPIPPSIPYNGMNGAPLNMNVYRAPPAVISFSLVNSKEFTAKSESGTISGEVIATLKFIPGAKFEWATRRWIFPLDAHDILQVAFSQHRHTVEPLPRSTITAAQLKNQRDQAAAASNSGSINSSSGTAYEESLLDLVGIVPDKVLHSLAPFQRDAVQFVIRNEGRALVADEMGLGKTRTAIASATAYKDDWPVLIICPSSARYHWQAELIALLCPELVDAREISVVESANHSFTTGVRGFSYKFVIVSYNLVVKMAAVLEAFKFNVIIADECHYLKSRVAKRTVALVPIIQKVKRAILLSGTPALSRPIELFPQLHALAPKNWPDVREYGKRYCKHVKRRGDKNNEKKGWSEYGGASNTSELHIMLTGSLMIRRLKRDVLSQLPKKLRVIQRIEVLDTKIRDELRGILTEIRSHEVSMKEKKEALSRKRQRAGNDDDDDDDEDAVAVEQHTISNGNVTEIESSANSHALMDTDAPPPPITSPCDGEVMYDSQDENRKRIVPSSMPAMVASSNTTSIANVVAMTAGVHREMSSLSHSKVTVPSTTTNCTDSTALVDETQSAVPPHPEEDIKKQHKLLLMSLFNKSGAAKLPAVLKHLGVFLDNKVSGKVLVFAHHRNVLDGIDAFLKQRGEDYIRIDGQTVGKERHTRVEHFQQSGKCRVAVLAITAAGVAITLTSASTVYFAEIFWTPGSLIQAEDRAHRIGQTNTVTVKYFLADDTVDELLWPLVRKKMKLLGEIVEGQSGIDLGATVSTVTSNGSTTSSGSSSQSKVKQSNAVTIDWLTDLPILPVTADTDKNSKGVVKSSSKRSFTDLQHAVTEDRDADGITSDEKTDGVDDNTVLLEDEIEDLVQEIAHDTVVAKHKKHKKRGGDDESDDDEVDDSAPIDPGMDNTQLPNDSDELPDLLAKLYIDEFERKTRARIIAEVNAASAAGLLYKPQSLLGAAQIDKLMSERVVHCFNSNGLVMIQNKNSGRESKSSGYRPGEVIELGNEDDDEADGNKTSSPSSSSNFNKNYLKPEIVDLFDDDEDNEVENKEETESLTIDTASLKTEGTKGINDIPHLSSSNSMSNLQKTSVYAASTRKGLFISSSTNNMLNTPTSNAAQRFTPRGLGSSNSKLSLSSDNLMDTPTAALTATASVSRQSPMFTPKMKTSISNNSLATLSSSTTPLLVAPAKEVQDADTFEMESESVKMVPDEENSTEDVTGLTPALLQHNGDGPNEQLNMLGVQSEHKLGLLLQAAIDQSTAAISDFKQTRQTESRPPPTLKATFASSKMFASKLPADTHRLG